MGFQRYSNFIFNDRFSLIEGREFASTSAKRTHTNFNWLKFKNLRLATAYFIRTRFIRCVI